MLINDNSVVKTESNKRKPSKKAAVVTQGSKKQLSRGVKKVINDLKSEGIGSKHAPLS